MSFISAGGIIILLSLIGMLLYSSARLRMEVRDEPDRIRAEYRVIREQNILEQFESASSRQQSLAVDISQRCAPGGILRPVSELFYLLRDISESENVSVEIMDSTGRAIAWAGRSARRKEQSQGQGRDLSRRSISQDGLWTYLTVRAEVPSGRATILVSAVLSTELPLTTQFVTRDGLSETISQEIGEEVVIRPCAGGEEPVRDGIQRIFFRNEIDAPIGFVDISDLGTERIVEESERTTVRGIQAVTACGAVLFVCVILLAGSNVRDEWLRFILRLAALWAGRMLLLWTDVTRSFDLGPLFDPATYGSPFGAGLVSTPGDLLLTGGIVLATVVMVYRFMIPSSLDEKLKTLADRNRMIAVTLLSAVLSVIFVLFVRGLAASIRSLVFDSNAAFQDATVLVPVMSVILILIGVVVVSLAFYGIMLMMIQWMRLALKTVISSARLVDAAILALIVFGYLVLRSFEETSLWPWYTPLLAGVIILSFLRSPSAIAWLLGSFLISAPIFYERIQERERVQIDALATDIVRPVNDWLAYVLNDSFVAGTQSINDNTVSGNLGSSPAFQLWSRMLLSKEGVQSGLVLYDHEGKEVDRFVVGIGTYDQTAMLKRLFDHEESSMQTIARAEGEAGSQLMGIWGTVRDDRGEVSAIVALFLSSEGGRLPSTQTDFPLREKPRGPVLREIHYSEISRGIVTSTTRPDWFVGQRLEVMDSSNAEKREWRDDPNGNMQTLFVPDGFVPGRVIALSLQRLDFRWYAFTVLKLALANLAAILIIIGIQLASRLRRGERLVLRFGRKLFGAFAILSIVPLIVLAYVNRNIARERVEAGLERTLRRDLDVLARRIESYIVEEEDLARGMTNEFCRAIAAEYDVDFAVYSSDSLLASTRPELYRASLFDSRLDGIAFLESVTRGKEFVFVQQTIGTIPFTVGYRPFSVGEKRAGVIAIPTLYRQREIDEEISERNVGVVSAYAIVLVIVLGVGTVLSAKMAEPIQALSSAARKVGKDDLDVHLSYKGSDEVGDLTVAFQEMARELQQNRAELLRAEREGAWKEMAKQVAHEIRNPLTPMKLAIQHLRQAFKDKADGRENLLKQVVQTVLEQIETLSRIATEFSHFAKMPTPRYERVLLHAIIDESASVFSAVQGVHIVQELANVVPRVIADHDQLRRVFVNVIRNSVQAMPHGGTVSVRTFVEGKMIRIRFSDDGPGIPNEIRTKIFEPNFSTKSDGMGLGLAISRKIIEDHGGTISSEHISGLGAVFDIRLPLAEGDSA